MVITRRFSHTWKSLTLLKVLTFVSLYVIKWIKTSWLKRSGSSSQKKKIRISLWRHTKPRTRTPSLAEWRAEKSSRALITQLELMRSQTSPNSQSTPALPQVNMWFNNKISKYLSRLTPALLITKIYPLNSMLDQSIKITLLNYKLKVLAIKFNRKLLHQ